MVRAVLASASLRDADLTNADLHAADLSGANLTGANLTNAWFPPGRTNSGGMDGWLTIGPPRALVAPLRTIAPEPGEPAPLLARLGQVSRFAMEHET